MYSKYLCQIVHLFFAFPQILFLQYAQKISLQATSPSLSQLISTNSTSNRLLTSPPIWFLYCSQIFFENANHAKDKKGGQYLLAQVPPTYYFVIN